MFNFRANKDETKVTDIVWMTLEAKWNGIVQHWKKEQPVIICWFDDTLQHLQYLIGRQADADVFLFSAGHLHSSQLQGRAVLFAEHYPLRRKEMELFQRLPVKEIVVHSALEEPLFLHFGGDRIIQTMKQMGMTAGESVCHPMISKAIMNAQEKIEKKLSNELLTASAGQWFEQNRIG